MGTYNPTRSESPPIADAIRFERSLATDPDHDPRYYAGYVDGVVAAFAACDTDLTAAADRELLTSFIARNASGLLHSDRSTRHHAYLAYIREAARLA